MKAYLRSANALLVAGALAAVAACGESNESDAGDLRNVARLIAQGEPERCEHMTRQLLADQYRGRAPACRKDARASRRERGGRRVVIEGVVVDGDRAEVNLALDGPGRDATRVDYGFVREDGEWKLYGYEFPTFGGDRPPRRKRG
ncbi:MAG: hypothetical protein ACRDL4_08410 [Thermoleophilaceae bacterium]